MADEPVLEQWMIDLLEKVGEHAFEVMTEQARINPDAISTILTRFKCLNCGQSIENTRENRCKVCHTMCADSETYNSHKWGSCPYAGSAYPVGGMMRDVEKVVK